MWLFCLLDPGQIRYRAIYTHPNQIHGYASGQDWKTFAVWGTAMTSRIGGPVETYGAFCFGGLGNERERSSG